MYNILTVVAIFNLHKKSIFAFFQRPLQRLFIYFNAVEEGGIISMGNYLPSSNLCIPAGFFPNTLLESIFN